MDNLQKEKRQTFLIGCLVGVVVAGLVLSIVFTFASRMNNAKRDYSVASTGSSSKTGQSTSLSTKDATLIDQGFIDKAELIYNNVVKEFYFDEDIDTSGMKENMYKAIISSLDDKYAEYYTAEELEDMFAESEGIYYGIGSYVMMDEETNYPLLSSIFKGSPAEEAGLRDGDIIYEVNGENIFGLTLDEAVALIKGPENTTVNLTIYRQGEPDYLDITVTRRKVESPTVNYEMKDNNVGYLQITEFDEVTKGQFKEGYESLCDQGMKAFVLDLRSNGGGNLDAVLEIGEMLLPRGIITYTEDKYGYREEYTCSGKHEIKIPVVVLTNEYTASASELLTGALHDYGLATVIGTNTFGKGIVQTIYPLADGSGIKITTSRYYTPNGVCIHGEGIAPDIVMEFDSDLYYGEEAIDNQLDYAVEYLSGKIN